MLSQCLNNHVIRSVQIIMLCVMAKEVSYAQCLHNCYAQWLNNYAIRSV
jgi:hypothetical protein